MVMVTTVLQGNHSVTGLPQCYRVTTVLQGNHSFKGYPQFNRITTVSLNKKLGLNCPHIYEDSGAEFGHVGRFPLYMRKCANV
jgi:hypothetical protein